MIPAAPDLFVDQYSLCCYGFSNLRNIWVACK